MSIIMKNVTFDEYQVITVNYQKNTKFVAPEEGPITIEPSLRRHVSKNGEGQYIVHLEFVIAPIKENPFSLEIIISGLFTVHEEADGQIEDDTIIKNQITAILFPYLRTLISTISVNANINTLTIPIIDIAKTFVED